MVEFPSSRQIITPLGDVVPITIIWLLFGTLIIHISTFFQSEIRTVLVLGVYGLLYLYIAYLYWLGTPISIPKIPVVLFATITGFFFINIALGKFSRLTFAVFPVYGAVVGMANLFLFPVILLRKVLFRQLAWFGALLGGAALIALAMAPDRLWGIFSMVDLNISISVDSNLLGIAAIGTTVAALELADETRSQATLGLLAANLVFLMSTLSRGAIGAGAIAIGIYVVDRQGGRTVTRPLVYALLAGGIAFVIGVLVAPWAWITWLPLSGRQYLWRATVRALFDVGPLGTGFVNQTLVLLPYQEGVQMRVGPHNSFLLVLLRGGVVAFLCYTAFIFRSVLRGVRVPAYRVSSASVALAIGLTTNLFIEHHILWGVGIHVVMLGLAFGYMIAESQSHYRSPEWML